MTEEQCMEGERDIQKKQREGKVQEFVVVRLDRLVLVTQCTKQRGN